MKITVNGEHFELEASVSIKTWLSGKGIDPALAVAELNGQIIASGQLDSVLLNDGDCLEIVRFVGGG